MATFQTTAVLGAATGCLMGEFSELHRLIEFYARGPVWTHQIPLVLDDVKACAQATLGDAYESFDREAEGWESYRDRMVAKVGAELDVEQPAKPFHRADAVVADAVEAM